MVRAPVRLTRFLKDRERDILARWEAGVRALPSARALDRLTLVDHIPALLDRIADVATTGGAETAPEAVAHSLQRLEEGFDVTEVVTELGILRDCVLGLWQEDQEDVDPLHLEELRVLNRALDHAVLEAVERFSRVRERTLAAIDRISTIALGNADDRLQRLIDVVVETTPAIDSAAIFLRDGDDLVMRAGAGMGHEADGGLRLPLDRGLPGAVASSSVSMSVPAGSQDILVDHPLVKRLDLKGLHGVPLLDGDRVIGVALMGSKTAPDFSEQDKRVFGAMAARATTAIVEQTLSERAERAAADMRERELQLDVLADNIMQLAWIADARGRVVWVNQRWLDFTGLPADKVNATWHDGHDLGAAIATGDRWEALRPLRGCDGRYRWFWCQGTPIRNEAGQIMRWLCTCNDVTERRLLDEVTAALSSMLDYNETLQQVARLAVPDFADLCVVDLVTETGIERVAIAHEDPEKIALVQKSADLYPDARLMGVQRVVATGESIFRPQLDAAAIAAALPDEQQRAVVLAIGIRSLIIVPLTARGRVLGTISLVMSDSGRHYHPGDVEIARELGRRAGIAVDNARLYQEAQQAVKLREDVLAVVSHDLRNPLGAIDLSASLLLQRATEPHARKQVEIIRRSSIRMERLISDLLDMASIDAGKLVLQKAPHEAAQLVGDVVELHAPTAGEKHITLTATPTPAGLKIPCDRDRIAQVFANIVGNAIKFCRPGDTITIETTVASTSARFEIRDTGPGISAEELPHIFQPYWSALRHAKRGTGLGLYICKGIVEAHGGAIAAFSTPGQGATFAITLPLA